MIRYTLFIAAVLGSAATAIAAIAPGEAVSLNSAAHTTVITKNQAWPVVGPLVLEQCAVEDCSDTPAN